VKRIWNKSLLLICAFIIFYSSRLFAEGEPSVGEWGIEDYKKAVMSQYNEDEILEFMQFAAFETGEKYFLCRRSSKWESSNGIREDIFIHLFIFNKNHEFKNRVIGFPMEEPILEAIARGIPGIRLWDAPVFIGDYIIIVKKLKKKIVK